jgi:Mn2+/Fe2+ NRAMP family transporter
MIDYFFLIIGLILFIILFVYSIKNFNIDDNFIVIILSTITIVFVGVGGYVQSERDTAIKCLKDNNPYKMEIVYELKDSVYVPKDTIYIKK